jgi:hypothetical protein
VNARTSDLVAPLILLLLMVVTRLPMLGPAFHLQDASWAVFFIAGFYLKDQWRWAFPLFMAIAAAVDYVAIQYLGISNYCVTVAYWFIVPAYASLWLGGSWFRSRMSMDLRGIALLSCSLFIAVSVCFLISNGSFYWIGDRVAQRSWNGWLENLGDWYLPFLQVSFAYVAVAALVHVIIVQARPLLASDTVQDTVQRR